MECLDPDEKDFTDYLQQRDTISTETEYDFCELWKPQESLPTPPLLHGKTGNIAAAESGGLDLQEPVARFSKHLGSVCDVASLCAMFSWFSPGWALGARKRISGNRADSKC
jgi:hypothetical protein